jgi:GPH family glycoside/pentoside/hexuronide:cation symporter
LTAHRDAPLVLDHQDGAAPLVQRVGDQPISLGSLIVFALPAAAVGLPTNLLHFYYLKFATDILLLAPATVGLLFGASKLWDALNDPLAGYWSDRTRSRWGRRRPWVMGASVPLAVAVLALWSPPIGLPEGALVGWVAGALIVFYAAHTAFNVPHASWAAELSVAHHERSRIFAVREAGEKASLFVALGVIALFENEPDARGTATWVAATSLLIVPLACAASIRWVAERADPGRRRPERPLQAFGDVCRNRHARLLLGVFFLENLGFAVVGTLLPFASTYLLETPGSTSLYLLCFAAPALLTIPLWLRLSRRLGKKRSWLLSLGIKIVAFGVLLVTPTGAIWLVFACIGSIGAAHGCGSVLAPSIQADIIDVDELATGERKEGTYFAVWNLTSKASFALSLFLTGQILGAAGFQPNVEQAPVVLTTIRLLMAGLPCAALVAAAALFVRFDLDEARHGEVRAALAKRSGRA